jgi:hypothetical protein
LQNVPNEEKRKTRNGRRAGGVGVSLLLTSVAMPLLLSVGGLLHLVPVDRVVVPQPEGREEGGREGGREGRRV